MQILIGGQRAPAKFVKASVRCQSLDTGEICYLANPNQEVREENVVFDNQEVFTVREALWPVPPMCDVFQDNEFPDVASSAASQYLTSRLLASLVLPYDAFLSLNCRSGNINVLLDSKGTVELCTVTAIRTKLSQKKC